MILIRIFSSPSLELIHCNSAYVKLYNWPVQHPKRQIFAFILLPYQRIFNQHKRTHEQLIALRAKIWAQQSEQMRESNKSKTHSVCVCERVVFETVWGPYWNQRKCFQFSFNAKAVPITNRNSLFLFLLLLFCCARKENRNGNE